MFTVSIPNRQEEETNEPVIEANETVNEESSENSESDEEVKSDTEDAVEKTSIESSEKVDSDSENLSSSEDSDDQVEEVQGDSEDEKSSDKDFEYPPVPDAVEPIENSIKAPTASEASLKKWQIKNFHCTTCK